MTTDDAPEYLDINEKYRTGTPASDRLVEASKQLFNRKPESNEILVTTVLRPSTDPALNCLQCGHPFKNWQVIGIDRGNEVDGIWLYHFHEKDCAGVDGG